MPPTTYRSVEPKLFERIIDQTRCGSRNGERRRGLVPAGAYRPEVDMLGKLTWAAIPFNEPLPLLSGAVVVIVILAILGFVTVKGWWPYLWREWLTSVDHKRIGVMYMVLGLVMLLRGFSDAIMMRTQQAIAVGDAQGYLPFRSTTTRSSRRTARS